MPKRSRKTDRERAMVGGSSTPAVKSSNTVQGKEKGPAKGAAKPITIPLDDVSPELKRILVREMIKGGRAKVIKGKGKGKGKGK